MDLLPSIIRTLVPYLVGAVVSFALKHDIAVTDDLQAQLTGFLTFAIGSVYYVVVRFASKKFPQLEWLLGVPTKPVYKEMK